MGAAELQWVRDEDLASKVGLYAQHEIDAEKARRAGRYYQSVSLRAEDYPARDPWDLAKELHRHDFDPVSHAGLRAFPPTTLGDAYDVETRRRAQEAARANQRDRFVVALGASVMLRDGTAIGAGARVTPELVDHPHAIEILNALVGRGVLSAIDPHLAWLRGLDPAIGPWVATMDIQFSNGKKFRRGESVREEDCPVPELPRVFSDEALLNQLTVADMRRLMKETVHSLVPGSAPNVPPQMSEWMQLTSSHGGIAMVVSAPNYEAPAAKRKGILFK